MDHQSSSLKFAAIGHQDNWDKVQGIVNFIRDKQAQPHLRVEQIKEVYGYIPPRELFDVNMHSKLKGMVRGKYIETFISPDELDIKFLRANINKVMEACRYAASLKIPVVSLGGLTSIVLECGGENLTRIGDTFFTTGNTLTTGFIIKGVEKACEFWNQPLERSSLLIIGATGDIGSACTRYFAGKTNKLLLCARQQKPLESLAASLEAKGISTGFTTDPNLFLPEVDIIICVASSFLQDCKPGLLKKDAIICDAGYPKNLSQLFDQTDRIFSGGMGCVQEGYSFDPDFSSPMYNFPANAVHGCLLEAIVLAMEDRPMALSAGRGKITVDAIDTMLELAAAHGVTAAPLFSAQDLKENTLQFYHERA